MDLSGRRESGNVEDRRGRSGGGSFGGFSGGGGGFNIIQLLLSLFLSSRRSGGSNATGGGRGGCGLIGIVLAVIVISSLFGGQGGGCSDLVGGLVGGGVGQSSSYEDDDQNSQYKGSELEEELATFTKKILAGTEDVWTEQFQKIGRTYQAPKLVLFTDAVTSGCGNASASTGPFYCSADQTVYIDLSFFINMKRSLGADGDFAYAYVIAHEVGHHVQYLLGTLQQAHNQMARYGRDTKESNEISVRLELQADFYAGVWAYHDNRMFNSLQEGDIDEGLNAAQKIGDDYLQKKARGYTVPESFNHGTSAQRSRWLKLGVSTGDITRGDTFSPSYNNL